MAHFHFFENIHITLNGLNFRKLFNNILDCYFFRSGWENVVRTQLIEIDINHASIWIQFTANHVKVWSIVWIISPTLQHKLVQWIWTILRFFKPRTRLQKVQKFMVAYSWIWESSCKCKLKSNNKIAFMKLFHSS